MCQANGKNISAKIRPLISETPIHIKLCTYLYILFTFIYFYYND